ncbi:MAG TPA: prolyl aminopeptidase [Burkholderiales bacterium]|nr:prolyl aminopeptidase [Burkholderiales bacterium]
MLFPALSPYSQNDLEVTGGHALYYELCGNPAGFPALFLHGGPGSSINANHRRFFDPAFYRIVLFDQRGCGRSTPRGEIAHNTTADLIEDIERLRAALDVQRWLLFGGSWGSTLALAYAQAHPERVAGMVLRGLFLASREEIGWYLEGLRRFMPEAWEALVANVPDRAPRALIEHYCGRVYGDDREQALAAARRWIAYENSAMAIGEAAASGGGGPSDEAVMLDRVRVQLHYLRNDCFLSENALLDQLERLADVPAILVQGRRDLVCPPLAAYRVHQRWPGSQLRMIEEAGHSAMHPSLADALVVATEDMRALLK